MNITEYVQTGHLDRRLDDVVVLDLRGKTEESTAYFRAAKKDFDHYVAPVSRQRTSIGTKFKELYWDWKCETKFDSSIHKIILNQNYLQIIGMGKAVVPYLLRELEVESAHLFVALEAIVGDNPVSPDNEGDPEAMAGDWLAWGRREGYIG